MTYGFTAILAYLSATADSDQEYVSLRLTENSVDPQHMVENVIIEYQWHVEFLFVKHPETGLHKVPQCIPFDRQVILGCPVGVKDRSTESETAIDRREMPNGHFIDQFVRPDLFLLVDESVLE